MKFNDPDLYPVTIMVDRYGGCYSKAKYLAFHCEPECIPEDAAHGGGDVECMVFWDQEVKDGVYESDGGYTLIGRGQTPDEALMDLGVVTRRRDRNAKRLGT